MLWGGCFVEITIITQNFHASVGKIQFSRFCFSARNFRFIIFNYSLLISALNFSSFCWQIPTFTLLLFRFQFSSFCWQVPIFTLQFLVFLLSDSNFPTSAGESNFHASASKFSASYKLHFQIGITCVISAQLPHNVLALQRVWD